MADFGLARSETKQGTGNFMQSLKLAAIAVPGKSNPLMTPLTQVGMVMGTFLTITTLRNRSEGNGNTQTDSGATIDSIRDGRQRQVDPPQNPT